jgi:hypothetical protein
VERQERRAHPAQAEQVDMAVLVHPAQRLAVARTRDPEALKAVQDSLACPELQEMPG